MRLRSIWKRQVIDLKTILMKFRGPFQSYGTDSHFEIRHTDTHPSKGAVLGLVAAAMGIRREEPNKLQELETLQLAVRVDQAGQRSKDYQIAAKYKKNGDFDRNYVTNRYYLEDAVFLVALEGEDGLMERIYRALERPYFQLFYGRRSCPVNYDFLLGIYEKAAIEQLHEQSWMASEWYQKRRSKEREVRLDIYGDETCLPAGRKKSLRRDQPVSFSQLGRKYDLHFEVHENFWISNSHYVEKEMQTEHDAFAALAEG